MNHKVLTNINHREITNIFTAVFTSSEGEKAGRLIGNLASKLSSGIDDQEIICFGTYEGELIVAVIFFTRLRFKEFIKVYMLAPVAVSTKQQGKGVGQALINYGLNEIKK